MLIYNIYTLLGPIFLVFAILAISFLILRPFVKEIRRMGKNTFYFSIVFSIPLIIGFLIGSIEVLSGEYRSTCYKPILNQSAKLVFGCPAELSNLFYISYYYTNFLNFPIAVVYFAYLLKFWQSKSRLGRVRKSNIRRVRAFYRRRRRKRN